jgi:hypothetical protein
MIKIYNSGKTKSDVFVKLANVDRDGATLAVVNGKGEIEAGGFVLVITENGIRLRGAMNPDLGIATEDGYVKVIK